MHTDKDTDPIPSPESTNTMSLPIPSMSVLGPSFRDWWTAAGNLHSARRGVASQACHRRDGVGVGPPDQLNCRILCARLGGKLTPQPP
jgi:hypothetical protein